MCLILFSWKDHPVYDLVLAANRDEFFDRPTAFADHWVDAPNVIGGRDLNAGGTWIGVNQQNGKIAALTNYRDPLNIREDAPSRGHLTAQYLTGEIGPKEYLNRLISCASQYNGFNLLIGDLNSIWYFSNISMEITLLKPGTYGLSNGHLNEPWPKVQKGKYKLEFLRSNQHLSEIEIMALLMDEEQALEQDLPSTGVSLDLEKSLSPMFIQMPHYGTRCSTMILRDTEQTVFVEKNYDQRAKSLGVKKFQWANQ